MLEAEFQSQILEACKLHHVEAFHVNLSIRSEPGWPDLVLVGANGAIFRELKTATGKVSPHQAFWLAILEDAGLDAGVWRPDQWPDPILSQIKALGRVQHEKPPPRRRRNPSKAKVRW